MKNIFVNLIIYIFICNSCTKSIPSETTTPVNGPQLPSQYIKKETSPYLPFDGFLVDAKGDSETAGYNDPKNWGFMHRFLFDKLKLQYGGGTSFRGLSGWFISNNNNRYADIGLWRPDGKTDPLSKYIPQLHKMAIEAFGVNDASMVQQGILKGDTTYNVNVFKNSLNYYVDDAVKKGWPLTKIYLVSPPYNCAGETPDSVQKLLADAVKEVATERKVKFLDLWYFMKNYPLTNNTPRVKEFIDAGLPTAIQFMDIEKINPDLTHPNSWGHETMATELYRQIQLISTQ